MQCPRVMEPCESAPTEASEVEFLKDQGQLFLELHKRDTNIHVLCEEWTFSCTSVVLAIRTCMPFTDCSSKIECSGSQVSEEVPPPAAIH